MPRGSSSRSGPPPDPNALRRERDDGDWITLPQEGRVGELPEWPLTRATSREKELWAELWTMPQAIMWERQRQYFEVALYVRKFCDAAKPKAPASAASAARQMGDSLGLTIPGLLRNRWRIATAGGVATSPRKRAAQPSSKDRFQVLDGGA